MAAAEVAAEAHGQDPGVPVAGLPAQLGPPGLPQSLQWDTWQTTGLLGGDLGSRCLGGRTGDSEPAPTPHFQLSYLESQAAPPSRSIKAYALHSQNLASVSFCLGAGLPGLLTGPNKAEEMKVCEVSSSD